MNTAKKRRLFYAIGLAFFVLLLLLGMQTLRYFGTYSSESVTSLTSFTATWNGQTRQMTLTHTFSDTAAGTEISLETDISPQAGDYVYVKSVYAPMRVYANEKLIYAYGQAGSYPAFMHDRLSFSKRARQPARLSRITGQPVGHFQSTGRNARAAVSAFAAANVQRIAYAALRIARGAV